MKAHRVFLVVLILLIVLTIVFINCFLINNVVKYIQLKDITKASLIVLLVISFDCIIFKHLKNKVS